MAELVAIERTLARHAAGDRVLVLCVCWARHVSENPSLKVAGEEGCRWRVVSGSYEGVSNRLAAPHVPLAGAPHSAAERAAAPLAPSTRSLTACGVPAERDPIGEHAVPTPAPSSLALTVLLPRSLLAPQVPAAHV